MPEAVRRALSGIIDYAGTFPPARLDLEAAVTHFNRYRQGAESWIVSRFVCPAGKLEELSRHLSSQKAIGFPISVVGTGGADLDGFRLGLESDARAMTTFEDACGSDAAIEAYEVRLPGYDVLGSAIQDLRSFDSVEVYLELPWSVPISDALCEIADADWLRAKMRSGGIEPSAFPLSEELASFLKAALDLELGFKLTAGLHHPYRKWDDAVGAKMHGFLNVLAACGLHLANDLSADEMTAILEDENAIAFAWDGGLRYGTWDCALDDIAAAREFFVGFGSCSVDEPLDDLRAAGLLESVNA